MRVKSSDSTLNRSSVHLPLNGDRILYSTATITLLVAAMPPSYQQDALRPLNHTSPAQMQSGTPMSSYNQQGR